MSHPPGSDIRGGRKSAMLGTLAGWSMKLLAATLRMELRDLSGVGSPAAAMPPVIYILWHNRFFCVPRAQYLGVTPRDIAEFDLQDATHPLSRTDIKRARDALKNDPFFAAHPQWVAAIKQLLEMGVRAEQQALAKWGLNYVIEEYLPRKLAEPESFLP